MNDEEIMAGQELYTIDYYYSSNHSMFSFGFRSVGERFKNLVDASGLDIYIRDGKIAEDEIQDYTI
jgi:hypothetical protein